MRTKVNLSLPIPEKKGRLLAIFHNLWPESILIISNSQEGEDQYVISSCASLYIVKLFMATHSKLLDILLIGK